MGVGWGRGGVWEGGGGGGETGYVSGPGISFYISLGMGEGGGKQTKSNSSTMGTEYNRDVSNSLRPPYWVKYYTFRFLLRPMRNS